MSVQYMGCATFFLQPDVYEPKKHALSGIKRHLSLKDKFRTYTYVIIRIAGLNE